MQRFDEKMISILVELPREDDGDEFGMLCLSQNASKCITITSGSALTKIGLLEVCNDSIVVGTVDGGRNKVEVKWKVILNDSKVEVIGERGAKKILLSTFNNTCTNKLKHPVKLHV